MQARVLAPVPAQVRRALCGDEVLDEGQVGDAGHADVAIAPRLLGEPFDQVIAVLLLLRGAQVEVVALRLTGPTDVRDRVHESSAGPELVVAGLHCGELHVELTELGPEGGKVFGVLAVRIHAQKRWEPPRRVWSVDVDGKFDPVTHWGHDVALKCDLMDRL